ncbi:MAG: hypothetical protein N3F07_00595 [Candidatus Micrarchaeota archaeon]|nr:hypothetical protein [Candidatus Micrarchaeota archaeon]
MHWKTQSPENNTYLKSDMDALPTISVPESVCAGSPTQINLTSSGGWRINPSIFEGGTASGALSQNDPISAYNQPGGIYPIRWSTTQQVQSLRQFADSGVPRKWEWSPNQTWQNYLASIGITDYSSYEKEVGIKYRQHMGNGGNPYGFYNNGQKYQAFIGMICDATGKIIVGNTEYSRPFTGSFSKNDLVLPLGQHAVRGVIDINRCVAPIRNIVNPSLNRISTVYAVINDSFSPEFSSETAYLRVENPFSCSLYPSSPAPTVSTTPGKAVSFSFTLNNGANRNLSVSSISLAGSTFSNLQISSPSLPFVVPAGSSRQINGTVFVPQGTPPGTYDLVLDIRSKTTSPDCTNTGLKDCNNSTALAVKVRVSEASAYALSCELVNHGPVFFPNETAQVKASCIKNGDLDLCPALNWTTNLTGASLNPSSTPAAPSPVFSLFTSPSAEPPSVQPGKIAISCANAEECSASCEVLLLFSPRPDRMVCGLVNHSNLFLPNDWALVEANCTKTGVPGLVGCPRLIWSTNIIGGRLNPERTPSMIRPTTNFSTQNAPVPQSGRINASSEDARFPSLSCANPVLVVQGIGPDYVISGMSPSRIITPIGGSLSISLSVANKGNQNVSVPSSTTLFGANCTANGEDQVRQTPPLNAGQTSSPLSFTCICSSAGLKRVVAEANLPRNPSIQEIDYTNNQAAAVFYCGNPFAPVCSDYV